MCDCSEQRTNVGKNITNFALNTFFPSVFYSPLICWHLEQSWAAQKEWNQHWTVKNSNEIIANVDKVKFTVTMTTRQPPLVILIFQTAAKCVKLHWKTFKTIHTTGTANTQIFSYNGHALVRTLKKKIEMRTRNEKKRYETFSMQIHAAEEVYNVWVFCLKFTLS